MTPRKLSSPRQRKALRQAGSALQVPATAERRLVHAYRGILDAYHEATTRAAAPVVAHLAAMTPRRSDAEDDYEDDEEEDDDLDEGDDEGLEGDDDDDDGTPLSVKLAIFAAVLAKLRSQLASKVKDPFLELVKDTSSSTTSALVSQGVLPEKPSKVPSRPVVMSPVTDRPAPATSTAMVHVPSEKAATTTSTSTAMVHVPGAPVPEGHVVVNTPDGPKTVHSTELAKLGSQQLATSGQAPAASPQATVEAVAQIQAQSQRDLVEAGKTASEAKAETPRLVRSENPRRPGFDVELGGGVKPITPSAIGQEVVEKARTEVNEALIMKAAETYTDQVIAVLNDPDNVGKRAEEIGKQLEDRGAVLGSKAVLIARDQAGKTASKLNELRQREAGVTSYIWSTSLDERVRETHAANEGLTFDWDNPPEETGHPGDDVLCRCVAVAVIPGVDDAEDED